MGCLAEQTEMLPCPVTLGDAQLFLPCVVVSASGTGRRWQCRGGKHREWEATLGTARVPGSQLMDQEGLVTLFFFLQDTSYLKMCAEKEHPLPNGTALLWSPGWR